MAARPTWKGFLKISLVNIPIRVFPATDSAGRSRSVIDAAVCRFSALI